MTLYKGLRCIQQQSLTVTEPVVGQILSVISTQDITKEVLNFDTLGFNNLLYSTTSVHNELPAPTQQVQLGIQLVAKAVGQQAATTGGFITAGIEPVLEVSADLLGTIPPSGDVGSDLCAELCQEISQRCRQGN